MTYNYPLRFIADDGCTVEFTGLNTGVVIDSGTYHVPVGHYSDTWTRHTNTEVWTPVVPKRIQLHNRIKDFK